MIQERIKKVVDKVADAMDNKAAGFVEVARKHEGTNRTNLMMRAGTLSDIATILREAVADDD